MSLVRLHKELVSPHGKTRYLQMECALGKLITVSPLKTGFQRFSSELDCLNLLKCFCKSGSGLAWWAFMIARVFCLKAAVPAKDFLHEDFELHHRYISKSACIQSFGHEVITKNISHQRFSQPPNESDFRTVVRVEEDEALSWVAVVGAQVEDQVALSEVPNVF